MHAIRVHEHGGPEVLRFEEIPVPEPGPNEVRIRTEAAGVNFIDTYQRQGRYKMPLPYIPGGEGAGTIDAVGAGVDEFKPGDVVAWGHSGGGGYAEMAIVPAGRVVKLPEGLSAAEGVAGMVQGMTAHYLATDTFPLHAGHTALIHAGAGGTGRLLVEYAKHLGARVITTVSTEEKAQLARKAGADEVILYTQQDFAAETRRLTGGKGVDVVYDSVGLDTFDKSLDSLRPRGYMVLFGQSSGNVPPLDPQVLNAKGSLYLTRPMLGAYTATREDFLRRANDVFEGFRAGWLHVAVDKSFPLEQAADAHRYLEGRHSRGKIVLQP